MSNFTTRHRTIEMTWGETKSAQYYMKEETSKQSRCFALTSIDLLCAAWHRVEHFFGWNTGDVETWWENERLKVGFRCNKCRKLSGVDFVPDTLFTLKGDSTQRLR